MNDLPNDEEYIDDIEEITVRSEKNLQDNLVKPDPKEQFFQARECTTSFQTTRASGFGSFRDMDVKTDMKVFLKFLAYHLLYFWLLGPLTPLIFLPFGFDENYYLFYNISMIPRLEGSSFLFVGNYACTLLTIYLWWTNGAASNSLELLYSTLTQVFLLVSSISIKYSTFSEYQLLMLRQHKLGNKELLKEKIMENWRRQDDASIDEWIEDGVKYGKIQRSIFAIRFLVSPKPKLLQAFRLIEQGRRFSLQKLRKKMSQNTTIMEDGGNELITEEIERDRSYFKGHVIFRFILSKRWTDFNMHMLISVIVVLIRIVIPLCGDRIIVDGHNFLEKLRFNPILLTVEFNLLFFVFLNGANYWQAIIDIKRKKKVLNQLNYMVKIYADKSKKTSLPIIDLFDKTSIYGWRSLYTVNQEYGKKFFARHRMFLPFVLLVLVVDIGCLFFILKTLATNQKDENSFYQNLFLVAQRMYLDVIIFLGMTILMCLEAASFNSSYNEPVEMLRIIIEKLETIKNFHREIQHDEMVENDPIFLILFNEAKEVYQPDQLEEKLKDLIEYYKTTIHSLEIEKYENELTIMGVRITQRLLSSGLAVLAPLLLTLSKQLAELIAARIRDE